MAETSQQGRIEQLLRQSTSVRQLGQNPFLLTMLCWVSQRRELPEEPTRTEIYDVVIRDLLGLARHGVGSFNERRAAELLPLVQEIAFELFLEGRGARGITYDELLRSIASSRRRPLPEGVRAEKAQSLEPIAQAADLVQELSDKRILMTFAQGVAYAFPHRSIAEYLSASELSKRLSVPTQSEREQTWELVDRKAWDPAWEGVTVFLAGNLSKSYDDIRRLLGALSDENKDDLFRHRLVIASLCLLEIPAYKRARFAPLVDFVLSQLLAKWWTFTIAKKEQALRHMVPALTALAHSQVPSRLKVPLHPSVVPQSIGHSSLMTLLLEKLCDSDVNMRHAAASTLASIGTVVLSTDVLDLLTGRLGSDAITAVAPFKVSPEIIHRVPGLLRSGSLALAAVLLRGLGRRAATHDVIECVAQALHCSDWRQRPSAIRAAGAIGRAAAIPRILDTFVKLMCEEQAFHEREAIAEALGHMDVAVAAPEFVGLFAHLLHHRHVWVRYGAASALGQIGRPAATPEIVQTLVYRLHDVPTVREAASWALASMGQLAAAPACLEQYAWVLRNGPWPLWWNVCIVLGGLSGTAVTPEICRRLWEIITTTADDVKFEMEHSSGEKVFSAVPTFEEVRQSAVYAAVAVFREGDRTQLVAVLPELLSDKHTAVRAEAARSLGRLADIAASPSNVDRLVGIVERSAESRVVREAAAEALGKMSHVAINHPRAIPALYNWLSSPADSLRSTSAEALADFMKGGLRIFERQRLFRRNRGVISWQTTDQLAHC